MAVKSAEGVKLVLGQTVWVFNKLEETWNEGKVRSVFSNEVVALYACVYTWSVRADISVSDPNL